MEKDSEKAKRLHFDERIKSLLGDLITLPSKLPKLDHTSDFDFDPRDNDEDEPLGWINGDPVDANGIPAFENAIGDILVNAEVLLPQGEELISAKVKRRHVNEDGEVHGEFDNNPILNTILYDIEFPDGATKQYAANIIAENMYSSLDENGYSKVVLDCILDHNKDDRAIDKADKYIITKKGQRRLRKTTIGWKLLVCWKDQSEHWVPLKLMKENYPVQTVEYAKGNNLSDEPAFQWWVNYTLKKQDVIIAAVKARV